MHSIYLDHAASTPVDPRVMRAMQPYFTERFGNPGSLHSFGQEAIAAVDRAREAVATALGRPRGEGFREIIFTGSATEANNLALCGVVKEAVGRARHSEAAAEESSPRSQRRSFGVPQDDGQRPRVIVSSIEHESVLETARDLERDGIEVIYLPVDQNGRVKIAALREALTPETILVSIMYGNNETGVIQPIREIARIIREFRATQGVVTVQSVGAVVARRSNERAAASDRTITTATTAAMYPLLHTDAAQCFAYLSCDPDELGVDLMTLSAHKLGGPKGVGCLFVRSTTNVVVARNVGAVGARRSNERAAASDPTFTTVLAPVTTGGRQEFGLRSATENVPAIAGFGKAVELAARERAATVRQVSRLHTLFVGGLKKIAPRFSINGGGETLPHILNLRLPGVSAADLLVALDRRGVAVSAGSACNARSFEPSHVLTAMGQGGEKLARESIRISFGKATTAEEVHAALRIFREVIPAVSSKP